MPAKACGTNAQVLPWERDGEIRLSFYQRINSFY